MSIMSEGRCSLANCNGASCSSICKNLVGPGKIGLIIFHVGSLPTAQLVFLCGSLLPVVLPLWLEAENVLVD